MDWIELFKGFLKNDLSGRSLEFYDPITEAKLKKIMEVTEIEISGDLLDLLLQTDGIKQVNDSYWVYSSEQIIKTYIMTQVYFEGTEYEGSRPWLFFSGDGCGDYFAYEVNNGSIISPQIGFFEPISPDKYRIVAPDLFTWALKWHTDTLAIY